MSLLILTRSFIVCIILLIATVAHSTEIQYLAHPLADFVHFLHAKRILSNLDPTLMKRYTYDYNTLDLGMVRSGSRAEEELLYRLMQINTMNELEYILDNIVDETQREQVHKLIEHAYQEYKESEYTQQVNPYGYVKAANQLVAEHNCLIQPFLKQMYTFYGTAPSSWQKIIVHPCRVSVGTTYLFYNRVFLAIESMNNLRSDLGTVIHETAHAIYDRQESTLQYAMEKFFLHYPSPYAPLAYRYLNEALATALGNGIFMKRLTGHTGITYNNLYIQGFAQILCDDVEQYMTKEKTMDNAFFKKAIQYFAERFPDAKNDLHNLFLQPYFSTVWLYQQHSSISVSGYRATLYDIKEMEKDKQDKYYDCNAPVCFVVTSRELVRLLEQSHNHLYLKDLAKNKLKYLQKQNKKGLYMFRGKYQRPYLFFIVDHCKEFDFLLQEFRKHPYFPTSGTGYMRLPDQE